MLGEVDDVFIGRGWSFPLAASSGGGMALVAGVTELEQAIYLILSTSPGERPMRPEFGCHLADFVFEAMSPTLFGEVSARVAGALDRWEPRIDVTDVSAAPHPDEEAVLLITVSYRIRHTYDVRSLVFPFYLIGEYERGRA